MKYPYGLWVQREGSKPYQLHAFKTHEKAEKAVSATYYTLNEFAQGRPWKVWVDAALPDEFLGDVVDDGL